MKIINLTRRCALWSLEINEKKNGKACLEKYQKKEITSEKSRTNKESFGL